MRDVPTLAIVVPCFNESEMLPIAIPKMIDFLTNNKKNGKCKTNSYIVLIDDGSQDNTWEIICESVTAHKNEIKGIRLACNAGHQAALVCGLDFVRDKCEVAVSIDADLQDDILVISEMILKYRFGAEIVLGIRKSREIDSWFKKNSALIYYRLLNVLGVNVAYNHADYRLLSKRALENLHKYSEVNLFLRGLPAIISNRIEHVTYDRMSRAAGVTKYPLSKMLFLAWNGITSFSVVPLRAITISGICVFVTSLFMSGYVFYTLLTGKAIPGWASTVLPMYFLGGLIMLSLGVIGEYLAKVFVEVKRRPRYLIDELIN
jgi:glycosyltransferase involved in cell wall biosynthesis